MKMSIACAICLCKWDRVIVEYGIRRPDLFRSFLRFFIKRKKLLDSLLSIVISYTLHYCGDLGLLRAFCLV